MIKAPLIILVVVFALTGQIWAQGSKKEKVTQGRICGNPRAACKADKQLFGDYDLPFETPKGYVVYESQPFYAIILKSVNIPSDGLSQDAFTNEERLVAQKLFPDNKVFGMIGTDPGMLFYKGIQENTAFMGVFAGRTMTEAKLFLKTVNKSGKYKGAYIKRLIAEFNGT